MLLFRNIRFGRRRTIPALVIVQILFLAIWFPPTCLIAQDRPPALSSEEGVVSSPKTVQYDKEQVAKVPDEKREPLNKRLWEGLELYGKGNFRGALAILKEIAAEGETTNVMFLIGKGSMRVGDMAVAESQFKKLLAIDPDLKRPRLELALVYYETRRYDEARKELKTVRATNPPQIVAENIDMLLAAIDEATRKLFLTFRFSQGIQWDTNVSSGPDVRDLTVTGGTLTLTQDQQKLRDWASITSASAGVLYDIGERQGLLWNTTVDLYKSVYFNYGRFNYTFTDLTTGPVWAGEKDIFRLPIGFADQELGSDRLSYIYHVDPSYEHLFIRWLGLRAAAGLSKETYYDQAQNGGLDNMTRRAEIGPTFYLDNGRHTLGAALGYEESNTELRRFTYTARYYVLSYVARFPTRTDFLARYQFAEKDFKEPALLYTEDRVDKRHAFSATLSQLIYKTVFASFTFNYIENKSNTELYTFDKATYTLAIGCTF